MVAGLICRTEQQKNKCITEGLIHVAAWYRGNGTNVHQSPSRLARYQRSSLCQISSRSAKSCTREKRWIFYTIQYFGASETPMRQSSPILILMYSKAPTSICQVSLRSDKPSTRYRLPNFVYFVDCLTQKTAQDMFPHTMRRQ